MFGACAPQIYVLLPVVPVTGTHIRLYVTICHILCDRCAGGASNFCGVRKPYVLPSYFIPPRAEIITFRIIDVDVLQDILVGNIFFDNINEKY